MIKNNQERVFVLCVLLALIKDAREATPRRNESKYCNNTNSRDTPRHDESKLKNQ